MKDTDEGIHRLRSGRLANAGALSPWSWGTLPSWNVNMFTNPGTLCTRYVRGFMEAF